MIAVVINVAMILAGCALGLMCSHLISQRLLATLTQVLGLCVMGIGVSRLVKARDMLCVVVCMVVGALIGYVLDIERQIERLGNVMRRRLVRGGGAQTAHGFTEAFVSASLLFCVGALTITGAIEAGLNQNYEIIISKGVIDGVTAVSFAATMGPGVAFGALPLFLYEGGITLLAGLVGPYLPELVLNEMCAVGGVVIVGLAINVLELGQERIRVANLLPAMFLPIVYVPLTQWLGGLFTWPWAL